MDQEDIVIGLANNAQTAVESNWLMAASLITITTAFVALIVILFKIIIKRNEDKHAESSTRHDDSEKQIKLLTILVAKHDVKIEILEK